MLLFTGTIKGRVQVVLKITHSLRHHFFIPLFVSVNSSFKAVQFTYVLYQHLTVWRALVWQSAKRMQKKTKNDQESIS